MVVALAHGALPAKDRAAAMAATKRIWTEACGTPRANGIARMGGTAAAPPCKAIVRVALNLAEEAPCGLRNAAGRHGDDARRPRSASHGRFTVD